MRLEHRVALVTGAAQGIGFGIAKVFSMEGARVAMADQNEEIGSKSAESIRQVGGHAIFIKCDVSNEREVEAMVAMTLDEYGQIDVLVNNAGVGIVGSVLEATSDDWDRCLAVNLKSVFLCSKYVIPHMLAAGKGAIINISSVQTHAAVRRGSPYGASKGGIPSLTRSMAIDFGPTIRVNSIAPGFVMTPLTKRDFDSSDNPIEQQRLVEQFQVMKRIARPEEIGYAAAFLASDEASFITGTQLYVDGGLTAMLPTP